MSEPGKFSMIGKGLVWQVTKKPKQSASEERKEEEEEENRVCA